MGIKFRRSTFGSSASLVTIAVAALTLTGAADGCFTRADRSADWTETAQAGEFSDSDRAFEINPDAADEADGASGRDQPYEDGTPGASQARPENNARPGAEPPGCNVQDGPLELLV